MCVVPSCSDWYLACILNGPVALWQEGTARVVTAPCACVTQSRASADGNSSILVCTCMVCGPREEADSQIGEVTAKSRSLQATLGKHGPQAGPPFIVNHAGPQCVCVGRDSKQRKRCGIAQRWFQVNPDGSSALS